MRTAFSRTYLLCLSGLFFISIQPAFSQHGDIENGSKLFTVCSACHGKKGGGKAFIHAPRLAGQHDWYLYRQLQNFRADLRGSHPDDANGQLMNAIAKTLPDDQALRDVVGYIATLKASVPREKTAGNRARGKKIFAICQSCHGEKAQGKAEPGAPRLADQHDWYLIQQLQNFRADRRGTAETDSYGQSMNRMAKMVLEDEQAIRDVVAYIETL